MIEVVEQRDVVEHVDKPVAVEIPDAQSVLARTPQEQVVDDIVEVNQPVEVDVANRTGGFGAVPGNAGVGGRGQDRGERQRADEFGKHANRVGRSTGRGQSFTDFV